MDTGADEMVLWCDDLAATLAMFRERLGFRLDTILPADDPVLATISGHGLRLCLRRRSEGLAQGAADRDPRIDVTDVMEAMVVPPLAPRLEISRSGDESAWVTGRAGMRYRDLLPERQGGRFIASHICIPDGGPVPDDVHHHAIRFQLIHCARGWVRLVYEDQGPPFVLEAGDCVLQPPGIRHRVLESSPGLEVVEVGCPAVHLTSLDHDMTLPTPHVRPDRDFGGQRFVLHRAAGATWGPWRFDGFDARDSGIAEATGGLAGVRVVRPAIGPLPPPTVARHDAELVFWFVLAGSVTVRVGDRLERFGRGDAIAVPPDTDHALEDPTPDLELLDVTLPGEP